MPEQMSPAERMLRATLAAHTRWSHCTDRSAATAPARSARDARWEREVDPDLILPPEERAKRAESARKAYFAGLALKSAKARRLRRNGDALDAEVASSEQCADNTGLADDSGLAGAEDPQGGLEGGEA